MSPNRIAIDLDPLPDDPLSMVSHATLYVAVHEQPVPVRTFAVTTPPAMQGAKVTADDFMPKRAGVGIEVYDAIATDYEELHGKT